MALFRSRGNLCFSLIVVSDNVSVCISLGDVIGIGDNVSETLKVF